MIYGGWTPEISNLTAGLLGLVNHSGHRETQKVQAADAEVLRGTYHFPGGIGLNMFFLLKMLSSSGLQVLSGRTS